jgi:hypothetical protein
VVTAAAVAALWAGSGGVASATITSTHAGATSAGAPAGAGNQASPAYQHPYRYGVLPTMAAAHAMASWAHAHPLAAAASSVTNLSFGGRTVVTGQQRVYLVFYGSQWGSQSTSGKGDTVLSGDPSGEAPDLQEFFKGLGVGNEQWSGVMTQYCSGVPTVDTPILPNPGTQAGVAGTPASLQLSGSSPGGYPLSWAAAGLPPGLSIDAATGLISGIPTSKGGFTASVTVSDATGGAATASFGWLVGPDTITITSPPAQLTECFRARSGFYESVEATSAIGLTPTYKVTGLPSWLAYRGGWTRRSRELSPPPSRRPSPSPSPRATR